MEIQKVDQTKKNWSILFDQIVKGNVIPVIGPEFVHIGDKSSVQFLIDAIANECEIKEGEITTFSQLVYDKRFKNNDLGEIHELLTQCINASENREYFDKAEDNALLLQLLSIPYFPFVITTTFDPIVENMMRRIHGSKLRVLTFRNNPGKNEDILNGEETRHPTLYYMFGKADGQVGSFVTTDTDMLRFSQSWMLPNDSGNLAKPSMLSSVLSKKHLLVVGYNYQDWLFRFFWYAMKNDSFGNKEGGMLAHSRKDQELIDFLTRANAFTQEVHDMSLFVKKLYDGIGNIEKKVNVYNSENEIPVDGTDVFISYSRGDAALIEKLYKILTDKGLNVWYDRQSMHKGLDFMVQIENAIKKSTFFVPVFTNTIIKQAADEHPYRKEWLYAVDHVQQIGGIPYCIPFFEADFDMDNIKAYIPKELKRHDAFAFTSSDFTHKAEELAQYLIEERERRRNNG